MGSGIQGHQTQAGARREKRQSHPRRAQQASGGDRGAAQQQTAGRRQ